MKRLKWLLFVPMLGAEECPEGGHYTIIEVSTSVTDCECVDGYTECVEQPTDIMTSCVTSPDNPVTEINPEIRCHESRDVGLQMTGTCTLEADGSVSVALEFTLLGADCTSIAQGFGETLSLEVPEGGEASGLIVPGLSSYDGTCGIFTYDDATGGIVVKANNYIAEE